MNFLSALTTRTNHRPPPILIQETKLRKPKVIRVRGFNTNDRNEAKETLQSVILSQISSDDCDKLSKRFLVSMVPSCDDSTSYDALVDFKVGFAVPGKLAKLQGGCLTQVVLPVDDDSFCDSSNYLTFDNHFHGFTQLYPTKDGEAIAADIIAITGLDGHAYGSWTSKDDPWLMWLRHFFKNDLANCRTMIYGYDSKLSSHGVDRILDYGREFLEKIKRIRYNKELRERPLIFIAHSFGGIILAQSLVKAIQTDESDHPTISALHKSTYGILFFGTPHKGLVVDDIQRMIEGEDQHPRQDLLQQIKSNSDLLIIQLDDFKNLIRDRKIVSFYETQQTRRLALNPETRTWGRTGPYMTAVDSDSALLQLPYSTEVKFKVDADHSQMVKFESSTSETYKQALEYLKEFQLHAGKVVSDRFNCHPKKRSPLSTVPFNKDPHFVERRDTKGQEILQELEFRLPQTASHTRVALVGLGGVGKSQVVIEYSYRLRVKDPQIWVFWVYAASASRLEQSFKSIAAAIELPGHDDSKIDIFRLISTWLSDTRNGRWLMILDNADDITFFRLTEDLRDHGHDQKSSLLEHIPQTANGSVLVTTRDKRAAQQICGGIENIIQIGPMDEATAVQLLEKKIPREPDDSTFKELVKELDYMPLAITQAAAYINVRATRMTVTKYLEFYRQNEAYQSRLLDEDSGDLRRDFSVPNSVIRTWQISFDQIKGINAAAAELLSRMAVLDRQGIPEFLLVQDYENSLDFEDSLAPLIEFSLISSEKGKKSFEMHRLVQLATRKWLELSGQLNKHLGEAIVLLSEAFPNGEYESWETCRLLLPHAVEVLQSNFKPTSEPLARAGLLLHLSCYNMLQGNYEIACQQSKEALSIGESFLNEDEVMISDSLGMLAQVLTEQGKYERAEKLGVQAMEIKNKVLGEDHLETLASMNNLAVTYQHQGRWNEAEKLHVQEIETRKRVLGEDHPSTLTSMNNLALTYQHQGRWNEAEKLHVQEIETSLRVLGEDHPSTLASMNNLASTYQHQGRWNEAEKLQVQVMETSLRVLGEDHPSTLASMNNLALTYQDQGRWNEAEKLQVQEIETRKRVLGEDHPSTLTSMNNLAYTWMAQGQDSKAIGLMASCADHTANVLGIEHPDVKSRFETLEIWKALHPSNYSQFSESHFSSINTEEAS